MFKTKNSKCKLWTTNIDYRLEAKEQKAQTRNK